MQPEITAVSIAFLATLVATIPVRRLALYVGLVDQPGPRKVHLNPIPLLGGLAIYIGVILAVMLVHRGSIGQIVGILAGATMLALVGILDDGGLLHHQIKLLLAMPIASVLLLVSGIRARVFAPLIPGPVGAILDIGFTIFWVTGITAAFSILDHMDGLCAGVAGVAAGFFTIAAVQTGQVLVATLGAATLGAALGFLRWNFNPAKIFMGDGGAMFLGYLMATLSLKIRPEETPSVAKWLVPVLILGVPIFDTVLVSISRARRGLIPFTSPGKDHTAHRLSNIGLGHRGAVLTMYGLGILFGAAALWVPQLPPAQSLSIAAVLSASGLTAIAFLESAPYERQSKIHQPSATH